MLDQLLSFEHVAIQCHDNPDADAIASGYGLYRYFRDLGKKAELFYSGKSQVSKPNLLKMLELLQIPLEYVPKQTDWPELLITVDCQYGAGNVSPMGGREIVIIDHHILECDPPGLYDIRPYLGSCSTLIWQLLRESGYEPDTALSTALYYGLFMDTGSLSEIRHPLDRDLRDTLAVNDRIMRILRNSNLSLDDLAMASAALKDLSFDEDGRFALVGAQTCDANILGFVSDLVMQVDNVDIGVVYSRVPGGIKYSVRTVTRELRASEIAAWIAANGLGSGGGHAEKAGGYISAHNFAFACPGETIANYFSRRIHEYLGHYTILDLTRPDVDTSAVIQSGLVREYQKLPRMLAYVPCSDLLSEPASLDIRMMEGDITIEADESTYLMIGLDGEVYPISRQKFEESYTASDELMPFDFEYPPTVLLRERGERIPLSGLARSCTSRGGDMVQAVALSRGTKIFTRWDAESYIKGEPGDWIIWTEDDPLDIYIVKSRMFPRLYKPLDWYCNGVEGKDDFTGQDVSGLEGCIRARKRPRHVVVHFAPSDGLAHTLEGAVPYSRGDAIITGVAGEAWPVSPEHFQRHYTPLDPKRTGLDGIYSSAPDLVTACQIDRPFRVTIRSGAVLYGNQGDWLLQYAGGDYGVVGEQIFPILYESCQ